MRDEDSIGEKNVLICNCFNPQVNVIMYSMEEEKLGTET